MSAERKKKRANLELIRPFPAPWKLSEDSNPQYGTIIYDANGEAVLSVWIAAGWPSDRQRGGMTDEEWRDYCCDTHWESESAFHVASAMVALRNATDYKGDSIEFCLNHLAALMVEFGNWEGQKRDIEIRETYEALLVTSTSEVKS